MNEYYTFLSLVDFIVYNFEDHSNILAEMNANAELYSVGGIMTESEKLREYRRFGIGYLQSYIESKVGQIV